MRPLWPCQVYGVLPQWPKAQWATGLRESQAQDLWKHSSQEEPTIQPTVAILMVCWFSQGTQLHALEDHEQFRATVADLETLEGMQRCCWILYSEGTSGGAPMGVSILLQFRQTLEPFVIGWPIQSEPIVSNSTMNLNKICTWRRYHLWNLNKHSKYWVYFIFFVFLFINLYSVI